MAKKVKPARTKRLPQRTCVGCREAAGKRTFVRLVRTDEGVEVDSSGKRAGTRAYLHPIRRCWEIGLKGNRIEQALRTKLSLENRKALMDFMQSLPEFDDDGQPSEV